MWFALTFLIGDAVIFFQYNEEEVPSEKVASYQAGNFVCKSIIELRSVETFQKIIIYEANHLLVLNKPVCIATQGAVSNVDSLFSLAKRYIKIKYKKPGDVFLGVVSRLDLPVSGVVVFAKTSKGASRLSEQFRNHVPQKIYTALVEGIPTMGSMELTDLICENKETRKLWIPRFPAEKFSPKEARLIFHTLKTYTRTSLISVQLLSGRKHQIRLQLSHHGLPIVGDGKYGAQPIAEPGICLHASMLDLIHPTLKTAVRFISPLPNWQKLAK